MYCTSLAGARWAGADTSMGTSSGETTPRTITTSRAWQDLPYQVSRALGHSTAQNLITVFCYPHQVVLDIEGRVRTTTILRHPPILVETRWKLTA
jgi:hypothetical protein